MMKLSYSALDLIIQRALNVNAALGNQPGIRKSYNYTKIDIKIAEEILKLW